MEGRKKKEVLSKEWRRMFLISRLLEEFSSALQDKRRKMQWLMFGNVWKLVGDSVGMDLVVVVVVVVAAVAAAVVVAAVVVVDSYLKSKSCVYFPTITQSSLNLV